jgi:deoxyadenosine/deoxycytidine kinase
MTNRMVPRIVEIVGPAGAGKSSLCHALSDSTEESHLGNFPDVRSISNAPFFIWNGLQIFPALFGLRSHLSRKLNRREFAWLSILNGWPGILQRELKNNRVIFLDQGPVYLLTEVREFGPEYLRRQKTESLWRALYSRWANTLDMIVWLDAADSELTKRIRSREKEHPVKDESIETALEFLVCYRKAYERTISRLSVTHPKLKILRFDTSQNSPESIACQIQFETGLI